MEAMTNITDLVERRRMRELNKPPSFHPSGIHIEVTLTPAPESLTKTGLFIVPHAPIEYVHDYAPATYAGLLEMPPKIAAADIPDYALRPAQSEALQLTILRWTCYATLFAVGWWLGHHLHS